MNLDSYYTRLMLSAFPLRVSGQKLATDMQQKQTHKNQSKLSKTSKSSKAYNFRNKSANKSSKNIFRNSDNFDQNPSLTNESVREEDQKCSFCGAFNPYVGSTRICFSCGLKCEEQRASTSFTSKTQNEPKVIDACSRTEALPFSHCNSTKNIHLANAVLRREIETEIQLINKTVIAEPKLNKSSINETVKHVSEMYVPPKLNTKSSTPDFRSIDDCINQKRAPAVDLSTKKSLLEKDIELINKKQGCSKLFVPADVLKEITYDNSVIEDAINADKSFSENCEEIIDVENIEDIPVVNFKNSTEKVCAAKMTHIDTTMGPPAKRTSSRFQIKNGNVKPISTTSKEENVRGSNVRKRRHSDIEDLCEAVSISPVKRSMASPNSDKVLTIAEPMYEGEVELQPVESPSCVDSKSHSDSVEEECSDDEDFTRFSRVLNKGTCDEFSEDIDSCMKDIDKYINDTTFSKMLNITRHRTGFYTTEPQFGAPGIPNKRMLVETSNIAEVLTHSGGKSEVRLDVLRSDTSLVPITTKSNATEQFLNSNNTDILAKNKLYQPLVMTKAIDALQNSLNTGVSLAIIESNISSCLETLSSIVESEDEPKSIVEFESNAEGNKCSTGPEIILKNLESPEIGLKDLEVSENFFQDPEQIKTLLEDDILTLLNMKHSDSNATVTADSEDLVSEAVEDFLTPPEPIPPNTDNSTFSINSDIPMIQNQVPSQPIEATFFETPLPSLSVEEVTLQEDSQHNLSKQNNAFGNNSAVVSESVLSSCSNQKCEDMDCKRLVQNDESSTFGAVSTCYDQEPLTNRGTLAAICVFLLGLCYLPFLYMSVAES